MFVRWWIDIILIVVADDFFIDLRSAAVFVDTIFDDKFAELKSIDTKINHIVRFESKIATQSLTVIIISVDDVLFNKNIYIII